MAKKQSWKSTHIRLLRRNVGCLAATRPRGQNGTPQVLHGVAKLCRGKGLRHNVAVLHRGVATIHSKQISDFWFLTPRIWKPIV